MDFYSNIINLVEDGISLIPVHEVGKNPFVKAWKNEPDLTALQLIDLMRHFGTEAVAVVLGDRSRRLVCLDIDTKYYNGFEAILFQDLKSFYPELLEKLKIEKTPSGGYHLFYRVSGDNEMPGSPKLASRESTPEELLVKSNEKTKCFIELKCNGGLTQMWPSPNYSKVNENPIPVLTWQEHSSLLKLCQTYNEVQSKKEIAIKVSADISTFYSTNPYEDFDNSPRGAEVLIDAGWNKYQENSKYVYFRRPGKTDNEVSASFHKEKHFYIVFTSKTELETDKVYSPSNLAAKIRYNGDKKQLHAWLVKEGFGKIKPNVEKNLVKRNAVEGKPMPANASDESQFDYLMEVEKLKQKYPYGVFWAVDGERTNISRESLYRVSRELGFRRHGQEPVKIEGYTIKRVTNDYYFNALKRYIGAEENEDVFNAYEAFLQHSGKFTISRLEELDTELILRSSKFLSYKFFRNVYVKIEKESIEVLEYTDFDRLIWEENIKQRDFKLFKEYKNSLYYDYLMKAIVRKEVDRVDEYLMKCIGYYAHDYKDQEGYWCIATESCENPSDGGGSGKNVFWDLLGLTSTMKSTPASMIRYDNNLLQSWNYERVFVMADMPRDFDLIFFKDIVTGNAVVNKKYINEFTVALHDMPKLGGSSNYSFDDTDPGIRRRVRAIEFTDFFTRCGGVNKYYKKMFPIDWEDVEYLAYDNFMIDCIQTFLIHDTKIDKQELTASGWRKQFQQKYNHLYDFIEQHLEEFTSLGIVTADQFRFKYDGFCKENNVRKPYSAKFINIAISAYCQSAGIEYEHNYKIDTLNRGRRFGTIKQESQDYMPF